ncbi:hypothetical protein D1AOALGA4SA_146 [Olavius algarvensis Delta 1 endosymbiont]|nr:hypothetical protein D1AOALGA4SA_146 [Olavius algarvensis Delta 1 endosymbiont]
MIKLIELTARGGFWNNPNSAIQNPKSEAGCSMTESDQILFGWSQ